MIIYIIRKHERVINVRKTMNKTAVQTAFVIVLALLPLGLVFNDNVWFDEAYTLALIRHDYGGVLDILQTDMHPPLYFISLKAFSGLFGYSILSTKIFSVLGYSAAVLGGAAVIKKHFDAQTAVFYAAAVPAIPMMFYFSNQQRSYSWCVCFVTLCFLQAVLALKEEKPGHFVLMAVFGLLAAYNHFFALLAVFIVIGSVNLFVVIKRRKLIKWVLVSDLICVAGYSVWMLPLLTQAGKAANNFWLKGVEWISVVVFAGSVLLVAACLLVKANRRLENVFAAVCVLGLQAVGLLGTIFVRPFYIGRYSVVILGIGACFLAFSFKGLQRRGKTAVSILLCVFCALNFAFSAAFEYNPSVSDFRESFGSELSKEDTFLYFDNSFGVMSYYYPDNEHLCTYREEWFSAFDDVEYARPDKLHEVFADKNGKIWMPKVASSKFPEAVKRGYKYEKKYSFVCDFNVYDVYLILFDNSIISEK